MSGFVEGKTINNTPKLYNLVAILVPKHITLYPPKLSQKVKMLHIG